MPPRFKTQQGQIVEPNAVQRFYWECWWRACKWINEVADGDPFGLVLNGDMIEGDHHHSDEVISLRVSDHVECAAELLEPVASKASRVWVVAGTNCHVRDHEVTLGHRFRAEKNPETGRPVFQRLTLDINGTRMVAKHHIGTTSRPWLEANALGAELASEQLNAVRNGETCPRIVAAAHRHVAGHVATADGLCLVTSAWQALTTHGHKVVSASRSRPGVYVLDWRGVADGELPRVHRRIYEAQHPTAISV